MKTLKTILSVCASLIISASRIGVGAHTKLACMMAILTPGDLTFNGKEVRSFSEAVIETAFKNPDINEFHTIVEDIVATEQIAYLGLLSKLTKADPGCGLGKSTVNIAASEKYWDPRKVKIWIEECLDDLDATFIVYLKNTGVEEKDWTGTDLVDFLMQRVDEAAKEDLLRIVWFSDDDAANVDVSPAGILTTLISDADYTMIEAGFWKQAYAIVAANSARLTPIAKNGGATYALQEFDGTDTTNRVASGIYRNMIRSASPQLRGSKNKIIISTESLAFQYEDELEAEGVDASFEMVMEGISTLKRKGVTIIAFNFWDRTIRADFDNGASYYQPHRAFMTTKEQLMIGIDAKSSLSKWDIYYDKDSEKSNIKGGYKVDAKIREDNMIQVAY